MNCSDVRFALAANPGNDDPALLEHLDDCASCAAYAADMNELDRRLRFAMDVPVPDLELPSGPYAVVSDAKQRSGSGVAGRVTRQLALAASIAGVAVLAGLLWAAFPRTSLASAVVAHMAHEPGAWQTTSTLADEDVRRVLTRSGVRLTGGLDDVTYARSCWFRGHFVPHLVVHTEDGPVTVLVLASEQVDAPVEFDEGGYRGTIVPAGHGSLAVLARNGGDVGRVAAETAAAIQYE
jgi:hypothetical protein